MLGRPTGQPFCVTSPRLQARWRSPQLAECKSSNGGWTPGRVRGPQLDIAPSEFLTLATKWPSPAPSPWHPRCRCKGSPKGEGA